MVVIDRHPDEPKTLLELKARKHARAAGAAPNPADAMRARAETLRGHFQAGFNERTAQNAAAAAERARAAAEEARAGTEGGAAAAAGVLTAVDEDAEGAEEAPCPGAFDYESDGGEDGSA